MLFSITLSILLSGRQLWKVADKEFDLARGDKTMPPVAAAAAATPVSTAWADFMTEEGMSNEDPPTETATNDSAAAAKSTDTATTTAAANSNEPRDYQLPLVKEWSTTTTHKSKKKKAYQHRKVTSWYKREHWIPA